MLADRWNPRLWLRTWLLRQSASEQEQFRRVVEASARAAVGRECRPGGLLDGYKFDGRVNPEYQSSCKATEYGRRLTPLNLKEVRSVDFSDQGGRQHPVGVAASRIPTAHSRWSSWRSAMRNWSYERALNAVRAQWHGQNGRRRLRGGLGLLRDAVAVGLLAGSLLLAAHALFEREHDRHGRADAVPHIEPTKGAEFQGGASNAHGLNSSAQAGCCA